MIQRIQSLFLLASSVLIFVLSFTPWWEGQYNGESLFFAMGTFNLEGFESSVLLILFGLSLLSGLVMLSNIFLYKQRKLQMKITQVSGAMVSLVLGLGHWFLSKSVSSDQFENLSGDFTFYFWLYVLAILLNAAARIFIKKDDDLVKSVDRFR